MLALKILLAINGAVFLLRASINLWRPWSFYLEPDAPRYAADAVRVLGVAFVSLGLVQVGMWWVQDQAAVRIVAAGSMVFAVGLAIQTATQGPESSATFHKIRWGAFAENALVAIGYAILLWWTR